MAEGSGRIGIVYPADGMLDAEFWRCVPSGVTVHVTRSLSSANLDTKLTPAERMVILTQGYRPRRRGRDLLPDPAGLRGLRLHGGQFHPGSGLRRRARGAHPGGFR